jgi:hypothetical protein
VHSIELLGFAARQVRHTGSDHFQASGFETGVDLANDVLGDGVWLDDGESAFDGHDFSCYKSIFKQFCLSAKLAILTAAQRFYGTAGDGPTGKKA